MLFNKLLNRYIKWRTENDLTVSNGYSATQ